MMIKPGISELSKKADSRYTLVSMAAKRARMIGESNSENEYIKPVSLAVQEIAEGTVQYCRGEEASDGGYIDASGLYMSSEPSSDLNIEALRYELEAAEAEKKALEEKKEREKLEKESENN